MNAAGRAIERALERKTFSSFERVKILGRVGRRPAKSSVLTGNGYDLDSGQNRSLRISAAQTVDRTLALGRC